MVNFINLLEKKYFFLFFSFRFMYHVTVIPTTYKLFDKEKAFLQEGRKSSFYDGHFF